MEVVSEAVLMSGHDGWTRADLTRAEDDAIFAAYQRGVAQRAQRAQAEKKSAQEERPRDETNERSKMLKQPARR